jgi:cytochrome P450 family 2 subfamily U polypeptide 1
MMVHYPDIQQKVQKEIDQVVGRTRLPSIADKRNLPFTEAVVLEMHRYATVAPTGVPHSNMERDVTFRGYTIPRGSLVVANMWAVHHDPDVWQTPDSFNPGHFLGDHDGKVIRRKELIQFCLGE